MLTDGSTIEHNAALCVEETQICLMFPHNLSAYTCLIVTFQFPVTSSLNMIYVKLREVCYRKLIGSCPNNECVECMQLTRWKSNLKLISHGPLARCAKLRVAHAPRMPGTFPTPSRVSDPDMRHGTCVTHVPWCMPGSLTGSSWPQNWNIVKSGVFFFSII